jgi:3-dehydroquinate synthase
MPAWVAGCVVECIRLQTRINSQPKSASLSCLTPRKEFRHLPRLQVRTKGRPHEYEIIVGRGVLSEAGLIVRASLGGQAKRVGLISNKKVFSLYGPAVTGSLQANGFSVWPWLIGDGERHKSLRTLENVLTFFNEAEIDRGDGVVALGGGVVGDVAGFAAAAYLRGVAFVQIPTTLLAQIDSSVGGKTGVNLPAGKNLVGSFHQPAAVVIDVQTLTTLPARELVAGWCECVKQGAVSGRRLFKQTTTFLKELNSGQVLVSAQLEQLIASHCAFKGSIVAGDEREDIARRDYRSRQILNFGHTIGHALEAVTNYRRFRHGEAVGRGMLVAGQLSKNLGLLESSELELLNQAVSLCGHLPSAGDLDEGAVIGAIKRDKKRRAGHVQWVLLERIGRPRIVDGKEISAQLLRKSVREALQ